MDHLFTPWRYQYVSNLGQDDGCVFCNMLALNDDAQSFIIHRAPKNFIVLNRYPYTAGHVMVVPYDHVADLGAVDAATLSEMMLLAQRMQRALITTYKPEGFNLGMNLGRCAGAGVAGHLHLHVLPRWTGDASFMTTTGETRHIPEDLAQTYEKLKRALAT